MTNININSARIIALGFEFVLLFIIINYFYAFILDGLIDPNADFVLPIDIFAIGFQEIVDLNASNIVSAR